MRNRCNLLTYKLMWEGIFRSCVLNGYPAPKQAWAHKASGLDENRPWRGVTGTVGSPRTPPLQAGGLVHTPSRSRNRSKGETRMIISGVRPRLFALLTAIVACAGLLSLSAVPAWAAAGTVTEFPLPQHGT